MKNIAFVIWMMGYKLITELGYYIVYLMNETYSDDVKGLAALINLIIWIYVGYLLYEGKKKHD